MSEEEKEGLKLYTSTSKCKRPNDDLVESECARFKASDADFGIISLIDIKRFMTISPVLQFAFFKEEKEAKAEMKKWEDRVNDALVANFVQNTQVSTAPPENIISLIEMVQERVPDKFPGRLPTVSVLDPQGGFWTSTQARTVSSMSPIFCPTVRFDMDPPELYYALGVESPKGAVPSKDAATHAYYFAGMEYISAVINIPMRPHKREEISMITDGDLPLNDLQVADFILGQITEENIWKDKNEPFVVAFGTSNTTIFARRPEQLRDLLQNDFFVRFEQ
jgi:hypothetical protein